VSVRDITIKLAESAGKIWSILNEKGCLEKENILELANLNDQDFHAGIGWLARENKVSKQDENCFKLDNTNLNTEIGAHAGKVWKILDIWGDVDFITIKRLSDLEEDQLHSAIGWLAREDKIKFDENKRFNLK
jgi:hypothetical protein